MILSPSILDIFHKKPYAKMFQRRFWGYIYYEREDAFEKWGASGELGVQSRGSINQAAGGPLIKEMTSFADEK